MNTFVLGKKQVTFTHTDRKYFPEAGISKEEVLRYYLDISPYLIPHLRRRPLTLQRWPEGIEEESFYQKNASDYFPKWLRTFPMRHKPESRVIHYPLVDDAADLLYLVNQGTLTFHTFLSRTSQIDSPDRMIIDIDPPEAESDPVSSSTSPIRRACQTALVIREELVRQGIEPLVKTSGKRGLHLAFPLDGSLSYDQARAALGELFHQASEKHPSLFTTEMRKEKREGRVYLDALRMSLGATVVPPYVIRATPTASVSMPITWEELASLDDPGSLNVRTAVDRVKARGDLWASVAN